MRKANVFFIWFICIFLLMCSLLCRAEEIDMKKELSNYMQSGIESVLIQLESMTIDQVEELAESSTSGGGVAKNWLKVKDKLGKHLEMSVLS